VDKFAIHRFWFEYTLLREVHLQRFESSENNMDLDAEYRFNHDIVSGRHQFYGLVDVGTVCSRDMSGGSSRQVSVSGHRSWDAQSLHCQLDLKYGKGPQHSIKR